MATLRPLRLGSLRGVPLYVHWTMIVLLVAFTPGAIYWPEMGLSLMASFLAVVLIHEAGHAIAARAMRCAVDSIELHPLHATTFHTEPWSQRDAALIAWAGVAAQAFVIVPSWALLAWYTEPGISPINAALGVLGPFSALLAILNLVPLPGLDGGVAWKLFRRARRWKPPSTALRGNNRHAG